jgi:hypothetical protein
MKRMLLVGISVLSAVMVCGPNCGYGLAQAPAQPFAPPDPGNTTAAAVPDPNPVPLDYVPPALEQLSAQAASKSSFSLDRSMLNAAAGLMGNTDAETKQAIAKLDGVSVHVLQFGEASPADPAQVDAIRQAYHLRGWKHVVSAAPGSGGPIIDGKTDIWLILDGVNMRGAVVLVDSPRALTLVTVAGNLSSEDLLHLRGHFGIPRFDGDGLQQAPATN